MNDDTKNRIQRGIKFFRSMSNAKYDSLTVRKYMPAFLDLVEVYINEENARFIEKVFRQDDGSA